jgi:hypothetical protein
MKLPGPGGGGDARYAEGPRRLQEPSEPAAEAEERQCQQSLAASTKIGGQPPESRHQQQDADRSPGDEDPRIAEEPHRAPDHEPLEIQERRLVRIGSEPVLEQPTSFR